MGLGKPHQLLPARTVQSYYTDLSCVWMIQFWMLYDIRMKINKLNKYQILHSIFPFTTFSTFREVPYVHLPHMSGSI